MFYNLKLEYDKISLFTSTWTVNHIIDENSPLYGLNAEDLKEMNSEFIVLIKGFDDTFAQQVHSRSSYRYYEIIWGAKFVSVYGKKEDGKVDIELDRISEVTKAALPASDL